PERQMLEYAARRGFQYESLHPAQLKLSEGYAGLVMQEHHTIHIPNLSETDPDRAKVSQATKENFVAYLGTPLIVKGEIHGVLEAYQRSPVPADAEWLDFLETLAAHAAIAIDNAQLFDHLQRANAELEQRVAARTAELHKLNVELTHANRAKDEFLATMSHELRTPLNSILGLSESLLEQRRAPLSEQQQRALQTISDSGHHLLGLINDILDVAKIEAGKLDIQPDIMDVRAICQSSLNLVKEAALRKSITLDFQSDPSISTLFADQQRVKQILVNLLSNAVKFTRERGRVTLNVSANSERDQIRFTVADNGIGIAEEDLKRLFSPFMQVDSSLARQNEGTGLGLTIVYKLTDLHGGSVAVESELGEGSRFTVTLPWKQMKTTREIVKPLVTESAKAANAAQEQVPALHARILVAEDNETNQMMLNDFLEDQGFEVILANDGREALAKAAETLPHLILMDIQMPELHGLEATRRLRADPRFASTPIIALTALAMPGDRERCLAAGANEYLSKPVSLKMLQQTIKDLLH
ncbi:MAG TPA: ATP-binding protein, partial [Anaerolineales bacterium]|nr:ATP-binding protein [Anaerolineales bacterium]